MSSCLSRDITIHRLAVLYKKPWVAWGVKKYEGDFYPATGTVSFSTFDGIFRDGS
jgi:hypothetical protein